MIVRIVEEPLQIDIYGFSGTALNKDYAGAAFKLMDRMWQIVKSNGLGNKGQNIWIYEPGDVVFAGVELNATPQPGLMLEHKQIELLKYAYYKHVGPYNLIKRAGQAMNEELAKQGLQSGRPYVEIYGHWSNDESKLETELIMNLK
jgi:hypothetical protein